jgi:hypothetical protein
MAKTYEDLDKLQTDRAVKRNDEKWDKITAREEGVIKARAQMQKTWDDLDKKQTDESVRLNNQAWKLNTASALKYYKDVANTALGTLSEIASVVRGNHAIEVALIIARGAIKSAEQVAEGLAAAAYGNFWSAGMHYASAAAFAGLAGYSASVSSPSGGGSIGGGALTTAGNLVFQVQNNGHLLAYRADTGEKLLDVATNQTGNMGPPITYMIDNKQYVAVAGGAGPRGGFGGAPGGGARGPVAGAPPLPAAPVAATPAAPPVYPRLYAYVLDGKAVNPTPTPPAAPAGGFGGFGPPPAAGPGGPGAGRGQ